MGKGGEKKRKKKKKTQEASRPEPIKHKASRMDMNIELIPKQLNIVLCRLRVLTYQDREVAAISMNREKKSKVYE